MVVAHGIAIASAVTNARTKNALSKAKINRVVLGIATVKLAITAILHRENVLWGAGQTAAAHGTAIALKVTSVKTTNANQEEMPGAM